MELKNCSREIKMAREALFKSLRSPLWSRVVYYKYYIKEQQAVRK